MTTFSGNGHAAAEIATALTTAVSDIPSWYVAYVLDETSSDHLDPDWRDDWSADWEDLPAPTERFSLRRRALNALDAPSSLPSGLWPLEALRQLLSTQPESVRRAIRDEVATAFAPYDSVPVLVRVYDYKYDECDSVLLANAALEALSDKDMKRVEAGDALPVVDVFDRLGLTDLSFVDSTWNAGYLSAAVHRRQFAAWRPARS